MARLGGGRQRQGGERHRRCIYRFCPQSPSVVNTGWEVACDRRRNARSRDRNDKGSIQRQGEYRPTSTSSGAGGEDQPPSRARGKRKAPKLRAEAPGASGPLVLSHQECPANERLPNAQPHKVSSSRSYERRARSGNEGQRRPPAEHRSRAASGPIRAPSPLEPYPPLGAPRARRPVPSHARVCGRGSCLPPA